ncbi:NAD(+) diphosphatase [Paenalcaligenes niemegkensis]|nr:NAD(+) diphosphatase [Paenalcaligenes niemegkensis]MCQ9618002.1 NAD(+) diphosphatase [Paenalcaligenes niemegkensis]
MNFIFRGDELLLCESGSDFPDADTCALIGAGPDALHLIQLSADSRHHTCHVARDVEAPAGFAFRKLRAAMTELGEDGALAGRAFQVSEWVRTHRYCGVCATPMRKSEKELCFHCPACGFSAYPRISPAMMVLIKRGDEILLAHHKTYGTARYSPLAGFVEAGENIEEAIHREVLEEVGLQVKDLRYFGSQSWPFPHSLMIAYTAEYAGGELCIQEDEITDARWFGPGDALPEIPMTESIAGRLVRANLPKPTSHQH